MSAMAETSWSEEPAVSGWPIAACLAVSACILFGAGLLQQSSNVTRILSQASQPAPVVAEMIEPRQATRTDLSNDSIALLDLEPLSDLSVDSNSKLAEVLNEPVAELTADPALDEPVAEITADPALDEPVAEVAVAPVIDEPVAEIAAVPVIDEPVAEVAAAPALDEPVAEVAVAPVLEEPVAEISTAPVLDEPVAEIAPTPILDEPVAEFATAPILDEPVLEIATTQTDVDLEALDIQSDADLLVAAPPTNPIVDTDAILATNDVEDVPASSTQSDSQGITLASLRKTVLEGMNQRSKRVKFSPGQVGLARGSEALLALIFEDLFLYSESDIVIQVASRDANADLSNENLSLERGAAIKTYLADRGLSPSRLFVSVLPVSALGAEPHLVNIEASLDE